MPTGRVGGVVVLATAFALTLVGCGIEERIDFGARAPADLNTSPGHGATKASTTEPVKVSAENGTLQGVRVVDDQGRELVGSVDPKATTWTSAGTAAPNSTYRVEAVVAGDNGLTSNFVRGFHTEMPKKVLTAKVTPENKQKVGVGMPLIVEFNKPIKKQSRAEIERRMQVNSKKPVEGAWHWFSATEAHYRPKNYWPGNNQVDLDLKLRGVQNGNGWWGKEDRTHQVKYGKSVVTKVNLFSHQATTYINGKAARTIPVTGGMSGWETRDGTKVVLEVRTGITFTDEQIGAGENYNLYSAYGLRVTWSGEFIHSADWSSGSHGYANVSHGCIGMTTGHSEWLWSNSTVGDPVEFESSGEPMDLTGNGWGDWNLSWKEWKKGSALQGTEEPERIDLVAEVDQRIPRTIQSVWH